jgi:hypothetical protein
MTPFKHFKTRQTAVGRVQKCFEMGLTASDRFLNDLRKDPKTRVGCNSFSQGSPTPPSQLRKDQFNFRISLLFPQAHSSSALSTELVEHFVAAVGLELMKDSEQLTEAAFREAAAGEPGEVFQGQVVERDAVRWKVIGAEFTEWHVHPADIGKIGCEPVAQAIFQHADQSQLVAAAGCLDLDRTQRDLVAVILEQNG